jgi:hypothetical protein
MTPRRLLPFLAVFLVLAGSYFFLEWYRNKKAQEKEEAKRIFNVKQTDISTITLHRQSEEIRLVKEGKDWRLAHPLKDQADGITMNSLLTAMASLRLDRDLGPEKDLKPYGLDQPPLVVSFTTGDQSHTLAVGKKVPGGQGYYARRDQDPRVLIIAASSQESLDRPLSALRNRALFDFTVDEVKALRVKKGSTQVVLKKKNDIWRWAGREKFTIYPDRLKRLLDFVSKARAKDFVSDAPKNLSAYGLAPPVLKITVVTDKGDQRLFLGARKKDECYARQGDQGPVVLMENLLLDLLTSPLETVAALQKNPLWAQVRGSFPQYLEDRRLWTGEVKDVANLTWGPPEKTWKGAKDKDFFQLTGPDNQELRQPAIRLELALLKLRELEVDRPEIPRNSKAKVKNSVELRNAEGQTLFRLEELGVSNGQVKVRYAGGTASSRKALVSRKAYDQWQKEMKQLTVSKPS